MRRPTTRYWSMRLHFGPDDDREFNATRDALMERFEHWLAEPLEGDGPVDEILGHAGLALEWKWGYGDGDLGRWDLGDVGLSSR